MLQPRPPQRHGPVAQLLIACSPLSLILVAYAVAQWLNAPLGTGEGSPTNRLGAGLHVHGPADLDRSLFGAVPTVWLQQHVVDGTPHWWDAAAALVYVTHFVSIPIVTALLWFRMRERFRAWIGTVLTFTTLGISGYVAYPAAPPWLASERGDIGPVHRISDLGWQFLHLEPIGSLTAFAQDRSNPVAAMPSLHAGVALLIALFLWRSTSRLGRAALAAYAVAMALTLVYTGEHYVADVLAGWLTAAAAGAVGVALRRRGTTPTVPLECERLPAEL